MQVLKVSLATAFAAAAGFSIHVFYGRDWAESYSQAASQSGRLSHVLAEPYPAWVIAIAAITALVPTLGKVVVYVLVRDGLPGRVRWQKGLVFGGLLLLMSDAALRQPVMDILVGVPGDVAVLHAIEPWLINLVTALLIAWIVEFGRPSRRKIVA